MGFASIIDVLGSIAIGGFLMLTLFRMNSASAENTYHYTGELTVQESMVSIVKLLEYDFRKIGYCEDPTKLTPSKAITYADTSDITFLYDVDFDGDVDVVRYYLGPASDLTETPNPDDRMLYRSVNGNSVAANLGVTRFYITYYGYVVGTPLDVPITAAPTGILSMQIDIRVENTAAFGDEYRYAYWRQVRLSSRNLYNR
ncbi:MAG: hypothetical protein ABFS12_14405 [Bacteroidota bacterium]